MFEGSLDEATAYYGESPTPQLILAETEDSGEDLLRKLDQLAENCDAGTHVLLVGSQNDIVQYRSLITSGVSDYLLRPLTIGAFIDSVERIFVDPNAPMMGKTIAVFGAEGGVGSSTIAHNIAWSIGNDLGEDVVIVDLDLCFGTAAFAYNQEVSQGIEDMLAAPERVDEQLYRRFVLQHNEQIGILGSRSSLGNVADIDGDALEQVLSFVRQQAAFVVLDIPHMWSGWAQQLLVDSDETVIIGTLDLAALRDTKNIVEAVEARRGEDSKVRVVLNHAGASKKTEVPVKEFEEAVGSKPVAVLPHDPTVFGEALNNGQMIGEASGKHKAVEVFGELAMLVTGRTGTALKKRKKSRGGLNLFSKEKA
ncbi:MAG: AAA family ATPase [Pseudomonadota bacterium]